MLFQGSLSRSGTPCLGVGGGALTNTFHGRMLFREQDGKYLPPRAIFIKTRGVLASECEQAIVPVKVGDIILVIQGPLPASPDNPDVEILPYMVGSINASRLAVTVDGIRLTIVTQLPEMIAKIPWDALGKYHNRDGSPFVETSGDKAHSGDGHRAKGSD